jgi:UDP-N-acetylglucosamine:LPS N-acetylglucosamine transferase
VSTGAGVAIPFFVAARILGVPAIYIEVIDRIDTATLTGRICYPLCEVFMVQWPQQLRLYPRAQVIGTLL